MMRDEVVRRRGWIDDEEFLELVGATNLIPGPNSTELAIHLGHLRAGGRGLVVSGVCFIAPAVVIVSVLAWLYREHGTDPAIVDLRYGVLPVIIAIVARALFSLSRSALTSPINAVVAVAAMACYLLGVHELIDLVAVGTLTALWSARHRLRPGAMMGLFVPMLNGDATGPAAVSLRRLFLVFLEIGSVLYGSGYVLLAFLQRNLVENNGWLSSQQLLDAIAVGQVTPGRCSALRRSSVGRSMVPPARRSPPSESSYRRSCSSRSCGGSFHGCGPDRQHERSSPGCRPRRSA